MSGWKGALYKELRLFFRGPGWAALLLPVLLLLALRAGMAEPASYVQPFPIAVRDLDNTMMSRSLLSQMERITLFSQLIPAEDASDSQLLEGGAAAVVTIPRDFFYALYTMEDCPVDVALNGDMPLEAALFQTVFRSVLGIVQAGQAVGLGVYQFCWGELTEAQAQAMYAETAQHLFQDALGRGQVFGRQAEELELRGALERRLAAVLLSVLVLFLACSAVKTLPEERDLGVLPRYRAAGGGLAPFLAAKFGAAVLLALPVVLLLLPGMPALVPLVALALLFGAFGLMMALSFRAADAAVVQRRGSLLLLASLVLGGALWPLGDGLLGSLGPLTLPYYGLLGLEALHRDVSPAGLLSLLWPVMVMGVAGTGLGCAGLFRAGERRARPLPMPEIGPEGAPLSFSRRLISLTFFQLRAMAGGVRGLLVLLCALLLCGGGAAAVQSSPPQALRVAVQDLDNTPLSRELIQRLSRQTGLALVFPGEAAGERMLLLGEAECRLTIEAGYGQALEAGGNLPLRLENASGALAAQGAREIVAGQATTQLSRLRAPGLAEVQLGRGLTRGERAELLAQIDLIEAEMPPLYRIETLSGAPLPDPFAPSPVSFATLAALLVVFTAASWSGADRKPVLRRMGALPRGRLLLQGSSWLALSGLGFLAVLAVLLPGGGVLPGGGLDGFVLLGAASYGCCVAGLALALLRVTAMEGRVDGFAPFLALTLCLLGGCFLDLSQVSPTLAWISMLTPPGLVLRAAEGMVWADGALLGGGAALFLLSLDL
ncbi:MAG: ABC transporter permease [Oscillospiraceae bacterium]|nr:ABC transporter permease [Oscillospiraceae bacterium]